MKRIIAAVAFAVLAAPVVAAEVTAPYDQLQVDRQLPDVRDPVVSERASAGASVVTTGSDRASGPWANDHNFIAPPQ